jgi:hypothetical protein
MRAFRGRRKAAQVRLQTRLLGQIVRAGLAIAIAGMTMLRAHAAGPQPDACSLIDAAQASKILSIPITVHPVDTSAAGPGAASMCRYSSGHIMGGFMVLAAHLAAPNLAREVASEKQRISSDTNPIMKTAPKITDVAGLGDAAFLVDAGSFLQLHVFAHGNKLVVNRTARATKEVIDQTEQLARVALGRLQ